MSIKPIRNQYYCNEAGRRKMRFSTQKEADMFIEYNAADIKKKNGKAPIRSYYCEFCCSWHVTSNPNITQCETMAHKKMAIAEEISKQRTEIKKNVNATDFVKNTKLDTTIVEKLKEDIEKSDYIIENSDLEQLKAFKENLIYYYKHLKHFVNFSQECNELVNKCDKIIATITLKEVLDSPEIISTLEKKYVCEAIAVQKRHIVKVLKANQYEEAEKLIGELEVLLSKIPNEGSFVKMLKSENTSLLAYKRKLKTQINAEKKALAQQALLLERPLTLDGLFNNIEDITVYSKESIKKILNKAISEITPLVRSNDYEKAVEIICKVEQILQKNDEIEYLNTFYKNNIVENFNRVKNDNFGCVIDFISSKNPLLECRQIAYGEQLGFLNSRILKIVDDINALDRDTAEDNLDIFYTELNYLFVRHVYISDYVDIYCELKSKIDNLT